MRESKTTTILSWTIIAFFLLALLYPLINSFGVAFLEDGQFTLQHFQNVFQTGNIGQIFKNSLVIALSSAILSVFIAFLMAFAVNFTNMSPGLKRALSLLIMIPMLLPTITYGFTIIYSIGNQGLFTRLLNIEAPDFYGFKGLLLGYTIYTLPVTFLMINNGMSFIDKRFTLVSRLMGDGYFKRLWTTTLVPLLPSLGAAVIQAFFMAFTDYGIPSYIGGNYEVIATSLYNQMLGTIPNFNNGAVISLMMLLPSIISMAILHYLDKQSIEYDNFSDFRAKENKGRDICFAILAILVLAFILMIFIPIFIVPFTESWPYNLSWTSKHLVSAFRDSTITKAFTNSVFISLLVAIIGTALAYFAAILTTRSKQTPVVKKAIDLMATISNTIPGMVLGLAFLLVINGTPLKSTFTIIIIANIIHYFSTPYLTLKSSLDKLSKSWETTAALMGDNFFQTVWRILTPNAVTAILEVMSYYFTNSMVTISAVVFLYSNADDEAIAAIESSLNEDGYEGQYEIQTFGTSELGGKLLAEGKDIEADMVTMSTFYLESAQNQHQMFQDLNWDVNTQQDFPDYAAPLTVQEGAIIVNDEMAKSENLDLPQSIKDLADPKYEGKVAVVDIDSSSTAWLMVQALIAEYGEEEAQEILAGIYKNASNHIESSGSGPLNKVVSGEVPFGFGLRHQVAVKQNEGAPISLIDPAEGNFSLTESVAVIDKDDSEKAELAQKMSETIIKKGRPKVQEFYPVALYEGEETDSSKQSAHPKQFGEPLTAELLAKHQEISNKAKEMAQK